MEKSSFIFAHYVLYKEIQRDTLGQMRNKLKRCLLCRYYMLPKLIIQNITASIFFSSKTIELQYTPDNSNLQGTDENGSS